MFIPDLLITISGIDGSGKTTLAHRIIGYLHENYGLTSRYLWCKFGVHPLSRYKLSKYVNMIIKSSGGSLVLDQQPSAVHRLYGDLLLQIHLTQIFLVVRNSLKRGEILICDRYIYDSLVDLQQEFKYSPNLVNRIKNIKWIPQPDFGFLLDLPEWLAFARKSDTESIEYLNVRREIYRSIAKEYGLIVIDAANPVEAILKRVIDRLEATFMMGSLDG